VASIHDGSCTIYLQELFLLRGMRSVFSFAEGSRSCGTRFGLLNSTVGLSFTMLTKLECPFASEDY
jgi:hypothetical protein